MNNHKRQVVGTTRLAFKKGEKKKKKKEEEEEEEEEEVKLGDR